MEDIGGRAKAVFAGDGRTAEAPPIGRCESAQGMTRKQISSLRCGHLLGGGRGEGLCEDIPC